MRIRYIYLTDQSRQLAQKIKSSLSKDCWFDIGLDYEKGLEAEIISYSEFKAESGTYFKESDCLVFIMASGIVVRSIAGHLVDKFTDPAVLVVDELGINVISLLSGHMGGANDFCRRIASSIGANPVITTATDINNKGAFDMLVKKMWANVDNLRDLSLLINSELLKGVDIQLYIDPDYREFFEEDDLRGFSLVDQVKNLTSVDRNIEKNIDVKIQTRYDKIVISDKLDLCRLAKEEGLVLVVPRRNVLGIGCRKNTDSKVFEEEVLSYLSQANIDVRSIGRLGSIDL